MPTHKKLFETAWPYTLSISAGFLGQLVTDAQVAQLGTSALAAMGVAISASFLPAATTLGLTTVVQRRIANSIDRETLNRALSTSIVMAIFLALPFTIIFAFLSTRIAGLYTEGTALKLAAQYLGVYSPCFILISVNQAISGYWLGTFQTKSRLFLTLLSTATVAGANLVLIPRFGIMGGALGANAGLAVGVALNFYLLLTKQNYLWVRPKIFEILEDFKTIFGVSLHQLSLGFMLSCTTILVGKIGVEALALASVIGTLSLPSLYLGIGYGTSTGSYLIEATRDNDRNAGFNVGAKALAQVAFAAAVISVLIVTNSVNIRHFFFKDPHLFLISKLPLQMLAILVFIDGFCCTLQRFLFTNLEGIRISFLAMSLIQWGVFLPLVWIGSKYFGIQYSTFLILHLIQRTLIVFLLFCLWIRSLPTPNSFSRKLR